MKDINYSIEDFYFTNILNMWKHMLTEHISFWMICLYLFFEYTRPQALFPAISFIPWAQLFLLGSLVGALADKSVKWVKSPVNLAITLFGLLIFVSSYTAYAPEVSRIHWIDFYSWMFIYFLIVNIVNTKERYYIFLFVFIISATKIAFGTSIKFAMRGFAFDGWGLQGPPGYFENSGELSILMLTLYPLGLLVFIHFRQQISTFDKLLLIAIFIAPVLTIIGASSRGSQIALALQLVLLFRKSLFKLKPLIITVVLCTMLYNLLPDEQKNRFQSAGDDGTSKQRLIYWKHGWEMMQDHPLLGVGYFNFVPYYEAHFQNDLRLGHAQLPHNIFVQVGTDAGFTGVFIFLFMILYCFYAGKKAENNITTTPYLRFTLIGNAYGILGFVVAGQFVTVTYYPFFWIGMGFIVAATNIINLENLTD